MVRTEYSVREGRNRGKGVSVRITADDGQQASNRTVVRLVS